MENTVVFDFTLVSRDTEQDVAIIPAYLAIKLLKMYSRQLGTTTLEHVLEMHIEELRRCGSIQEALEVSTSFIQERELIENASNEDWSAYTVPAPKSKAACVGTHF